MGFGMVLLQRLTRIHISATLVGAQILGAGVTMLARAVGPTMLGRAWLWVGLVSQLIKCAGVFEGVSEGAVE
jgi:alpha-1,3-glucan synthase